MLSFDKKINHLKQYLAIKNDNYGDKMKDEIFDYFDNIADFSFLDNLNSVQDIENKIELIVSKMILNEHQDGLKNIIQNYI
jgi:hypothetical protein